MRNKKEGIKHKNRTNRGEIKKTQEKKQYIIQRGDKT